MIKKNMNNLIDKLKKEFPKICLNEPLKSYCTFHIGGPADIFYRAKNTDEIKKLIEIAKEHSLHYFIFGGGSNILFDDKGFRGLVIKIETQNIEINNDEITSDSGVLVSKLIQTALSNGLSGIEQWFLLPGTVGGAVRGNAGCNGLETKDIFIKTKILDPNTGEIKEINKKNLKFSYRYSCLKDTDEIILSATFKLKSLPLPEEESKKIMQEIQSQRFKKQPIGLSGGSFFKNPEPQKAGFLIEKAGLKGKTIGYAQVSEKHANFIINLGGATSEDIKNLAKLIKREIKKKFNINLEEEIQILSEYGKIKI